MFLSIVSHDWIAVFGAPGAKKYIKTKPMTKQSKQASALLSKVPNKVLV